MLLSSKTLIPESNEWLEMDGDGHTETGDDVK